MAILTVWINDETEARLKRAARDMGGDRSMEDLAECAVAEAALEATRHLTREELADA